MSIEIYYISGTGNSLYVARELQSKLPDSKLIPIISLLNQETIETVADTIGLVFPIHGPTFTDPVKLFLQKVNLKSAVYIFAIATRAGTSNVIQKEIDKLLKRNNKKLNSHFVLTIFNNDPKLKLDDNKKHSVLAPTEENLKEKDLEVKEKIDRISKIIINKKNCHEKDKEYSYKYSFIMTQIILFIIKTSKGVDKNYFYIDSKCNGCGICKNICLSERIEIKDGKPFWKEDVLCYMCYACLNYCPKESIQIKSNMFMKSYTTTQGRYSHPFANTKDIERQKIKQS